MVRVGTPLVICEVLFRSPRGVERSKRKKPCRSSIDSIAKVTYWPCFLLNTYEERHNTRYRGTADHRLHTCQDSSEATSRCQQEKPKMVHTASNKTSAPQKQLLVLHKHLSRYKLSNRSFSNPFLTLESDVQLL